MSVTAIGLPPISTEIIVSTDKIATNMQQAGKILDSEAKKIQGRFDRIGLAGASLNKLGGNLTKFVTLPLAGLGITATKMAVDFESSFAKVSTLLDKNQVDYKQYKKEILKASSEANVAVNDFAESVYGSISAGIDQKKAIGFTTEAMKLAKGGFTSGAKAVDVLTTAINGYKLSAEDTTQISDLLITTQNLGKTTVDELAASMGRVIPIASSANFKIEELSTSYAVLTKNGIATAEAGTYLKSMLSEITKAGSDSDKALRELTNKGFAELKAEGKGTSEILNMLSAYAKKSGKTLKDMFGSVEAGSAALVLANQDGKEYNEILALMGKSAGATQEAFDKINSTPAERMARAMNNMKNKAIEIGDKLLPVFEKVFGLVEKGVNWFTSLDDKTQEMYLKWGVGLIAAGPLIKGFGGILSTASKLPKVWGLIKSGLGLFGGKALIATKTATGLTAALGGTSIGLGTAAAAAAPFVLGAGLVAGAGYAIYKGLEQKATPAVNNLADGFVKTGTRMVEINGQMVEVAETTSVKISEETKKQMESYFKLSESAQQSTIQLFSKVGPITDENIKAITTNVDQMASTTIKAIDSQKESNIQSFEELFGKSTTLTSEQKTKILEDVTTMAEERKTKVENMKKRIVELYEEIKKKGVKNATEEKKELDKLYQEMANEQIRAVAKSKNEQELIISNMIKNKDQMTSRHIEQEIVKLNKQRDDSAKATEEKYQKMIDFAVSYKTDIELQNGKLTEQEVKHYQGLVHEAEKYREEATREYTNLRNGGIKKLYEAFPELTRNIDIETGKQLSTIYKLFVGVQDNVNKINALKYDDKEYSVTRNEITNHIESYAVVSGIAGQFSHRSNGLDYVPYDGYKAHLHKGERILTAEENKIYSNKEYGDINISIEKVENNTQEDVRSLIRRIGAEIKRQNMGRGQ